VEGVDESLNLALLVCSAANLSLIFLYWTYLLYSSFSLSALMPPVFPHVILLSISIGSSSNLAWVTLSPSPLSSCYTALLLPLSYASLYSALLTRLVYLHSLHKDLYKLPSLYQGLLLCFTVLVQVSLTTQALLVSPAPCPASALLDLLTFSYPLLLLSSTSCLAALLRHRREHRREAGAVWRSSLLFVLVWVAWTAVGLVYERYYRQVKGLGLEVATLLLFISFLLPRARRHTFIGKGSGRGGAALHTRHNTFAASPDTSSYLGFHRPTRVVPPSSHSSSNSSRPPFLLPTSRYARLDAGGPAWVLPYTRPANPFSGVLPHQFGRPHKRNYEEYVSFHDKYNFGL